MLGVVVPGLVVPGLVVPSLVVPGLVVPGVAWADPSGRCTLDDPRLAETSGLVVAPDGGYEVVNDGGNPSTVYRLDTSCAVIGQIEVPDRGRDVEDLTRDADGTLWLADIGDNDRERRTVAILRVSSGGDETITRLTYPDGPHDAESLLMPGDRRPVIVTKELGGRSGVYVADEPVGEGGTGTLRRAGEVVVPGEAMTTLGSGAHTGGAISADGRVVALRTYADAWLHPAPDGTATADDVVAALRATPLRVPLPGEVQGEALAFAPDGTLLSTGETPEDGPPAPLHAVPGATALVEGSASASSTPAPAVAPTSERAGLPEPLASIGVVLAVAVGVFALVAVVAVVRRAGLTPQRTTCRRAHGDVLPGVRAGAAPRPPCRARWRPRRGSARSRRCAASARRGRPCA
ncbi:hypothetical protein PHK61_10615 [Actinomycetospora lutea]|uniref:hypothetical protein n=1 Tax=Actinomycetospora lutea TaxID=663604 RepID=UPI002365E204|nr:hypothetical protein [Actinomycetospora lutea]MDD7938869.1 hypothetical protein [Actinomycetospora lutea]